MNDHEDTGAAKPRSGHDVRHLLTRAGGHDIGSVLVERKMVSKKALHAATMESRITGNRIGLSLVRNGLLSQRDLIQTILGIAPEALMTERVATSRVPIDTLRRHNIVLAAETAEAIFVATLSNEDTTRRIVAEWYPEKSVVFVPYIASQASEFHAIVQQSGIEGDLGEEDERLDQLITRAYEKQASDIHFIPKASTFSVFFRILGERQLVHEGTIGEYQLLSAQIKNRAGMDIAETRRAQDGIFHMEFAAKVVDFRTVTVPTTNGEYVVMRILDPDRVQNRLDDLGITRVEHWRRGFNQANGLCIICGPTGSGKTTTLNATVGEMDRFGKAIFTVEDPVEYPISFTGQVNINESVGLDFARTVRAFMRADPDIINIGEVRDEETARAMVRAAETGHLVLATLHASSIRGAVSRLEYLGVPPHDLRFIMRSLMVQNLVKTMCRRCKGDGCDACFDTGYGGRRIVSEVQSFTDEGEFDRMVNGEIFWPTVIEDAVNLLEAGDTDLRELDRVYGVRVHEEIGRRQARQIDGTVIRPDPVIPGG